MVVFKHIRILLKSIDFSTSKGLEKFVGQYETHI